MTLRREGDGQIAVWRNRGRSDRGRGRYIAHCDQALAIAGTAGLRIKRIIAEPKSVKTGAVPVGPGDARRAPFINDLEPGYLHERLAFR